MMTVEVRDANKVSEGLAEVEVFCDADGLALLAKQIEQLRAGSSHVHLMTPSWSGNELAEVPVGKGTTLINHLRITMVRPASP